MAETEGEPTEASPRVAGSVKPSGVRFFDPEAELPMGATLWDWCARWLLVAFTVLLIHGAWSVGPTYDEHVYVSAGYAYLQDGDYSLNREHPPLLKMMAGGPLTLLPEIEFSEDWREQLDYPVAFFYQENAQWLDRNLFVARLPFCLLTAICAWVLFRTARQLFGPRAGFAGLLLFATNPNVLAHGKLVSLDAGSMGFIFLAVVSFVALLERATAWRALLAGVLFGLACLSKFTALTLVPVFVVLALVQMLRKLSILPLWHLFRVAFVGLTIFAFGYGFEAKSINEAWGEPSYATAIEREDPTPADLEVALRESVGAGEWDVRMAEVGRAPDAAGALDVWRSLLSSPQPENAADRAGMALAAFEDATGETRKLAFQFLLEANDENVEASTKIDVLARLADREVRAENGSALPPDENGVAVWRDWWDANLHADWDRVIFTQPWIEQLTRGLFGDSRRIPLLTAFKGIDYQLYHADVGHGTYYRGVTLKPGDDFAEGNPYPGYYADVLYVKNPLAACLMAALGLLISVRLIRSWTLLHFLAYVGFPAGLFYLMSDGSALMGVRYVLPLFPFIALMAARVELRLPRLGILLATIAALESLWIHPHELMYYNALAGGPKGGTEITVVGDDWAQDVRRLGRWYEEHREDVEASGGLFYDPYTRANLDVFNLEDSRPITDGARGIVALHAIHQRRDHARYVWLEEYDPFARLGWSILLIDTRLEPPGGKPDWLAGAVDERDERTD